MDDIIFKLQTLQEDKPNLIITDELIKEYILEDIDLIIKEISEEVCNYEYK